MALEQVGILEISVRGVARYEQVVKLLEPYRSLNTLSKTCEMWLKDRLDEELGQDTYQLTIQISQRSLTMLNTIQTTLMLVGWFLIALLTVLMLVMWKLRQGI